MERILILEDDAALGAGIRMALQTPETEAVLCHTLKDARRTLMQEAFSLLILDINLPDGSGLELLREQKSIRPEVPVILLTANDLELDEVTGLEAGADDYIIKPFSLSVLRARVAVQLRRGRPASSSVVVTGPFRFDFDRMEFYRDGKAVELSRTEQKLLRVLVENRGHTVNRAVLVDRVWTDGAEYVEENALSVTVKRLRARLEAEPAKPQYLRTVYGVGYIWAAGGTAE
ncbi:MAG TPA: response regulator transcription factor [Candidatus Eisenbergiella intestinipullorum]|nr:response regulator transcription factor [Candidatus Eisenbergiella intestinipullorum]